MIKSIRHLRADEATWAANDIIVPDGELALLKTKGGYTKIKVGDGQHSFSTLPSLTGEAVNLAESSVELQHGRSYRLGQMDAVTVSFPSVIDDDYYAELTFDSGADATVFEVMGSVALSGDDVADRELMPRENTHYTVFIWYDGTLQGIVRGIPNA